MVTAVGTHPSFTQRIKTVLVTGSLALSVLLSVAGTTATVSAAPKQPPVYCEKYSQAETIRTFGFDPGEGGYWNCDFTPIVGGHVPGT